MAKSTYDKTKTNRLSAACLLALLAGNCLADGAGPVHAEKRRAAHEHHPHRRDYGGDGGKENIVTFYQTEVIYVNQEGRPLSTELAMPYRQDGGYDNLAIPGSPLSMTDESSPSSTPAISPKDDGGYEKSGSTKPPAVGGGEFQDGQIPCSDFPSQYGAVSIMNGNIKHDGWTGIQIGNAAGQGGCEKGAYCSYACPPGQLKTQWPESQPADGQTRGGLLCGQDGMLYLTRPSVKQLCVSGYGSANAVNQMSSGVAICQTDYPGSENMVVPTFVNGGGQSPLTVLDSGNCFYWKGDPTTSQFYVNKLGVSADNGCWWGNQASGVGNYAPLVFGAGFNRQQGNTYLSITPNPNAVDSSGNCADAGYDVEIKPAPGAKVNGDCAYRGNHMYSGGKQLGPKMGCTVTVTEGQANFVFTSRK